VDTSPVVPYQPGRAVAALPPARATAAGPKKTVTTKLVRTLKTNSEKNEPRGRGEIQETNFKISICGAAGWTNLKKTRVVIKKFAKKMESGETF